MALQTPETAVEWVGGLISVPAYITGDGQPYRPEVLFWLDEHGVVLSSKVAKPNQLLQAAPQSLLQTIGQPLFGHRRTPTAIRVASKALARTLRAACPGLEIRCAATPEIDALFSAMREKFAQQPLQQPSYLSGGVEADAMAACFEAAAGLFRAAPWRSIASDQHLLTVSVAELGLQHAPLSVVGQLGKSLGLVLFSNHADFQAYLTAGATLARGEVPSLPAHFTLHFERGSELCATLRKQILSHGWKVAGADAYPWMLVTDEDLVARMPTATEVTIAEVIARTLPPLLDESRPALQAAWSGGKPMSYKLMATTYAGSYEVTWMASDKAEPQLHWAIDDVFYQYAQLLECVKIDSDPHTSKAER